MRDTEKKLFNGELSEREARAITKNDWAAAGQSRELLAAVKEALHFGARVFDKGGRGERFSIVLPKVGDFHPVIRSNSTGDLSSWDEIPSITPALGQEVTMNWIPATVRRCVIAAIEETEDQ